MRTVNACHTFARSAWNCLQLVQDDIDRGFFVSDATVTAADPDNLETNQTAEVSTDLVRSPLISLGE